MDSVSSDMKEYTFKVCLNPDDVEKLKTHGASILFHADRDGCFDYGVYPIQDLFEEIIDEVLKNE